MDNNRQSEDARIDIMQKDVGQIKRSVGRIEMALFGDEELNHTGLIEESKNNKTSIKSLNNFKTGIQIAAGFIAFIATLLTNIVLHFIGGN